MISPNMLARIRFKAEFVPQVGLVAQIKPVLLVGYGRAGLKSFFNRVFANRSLKLHQRNAVGLGGAMTSVNTLKKAKATY
ncbi:hypothetical protein [Stenotrophomonas acidaminiphila]